jgi:hypothetical protein
MKDGSRAFLKKSTKKLFLIWPLAVARMVIETSWMAVPAMTGCDLGGVR